MDRNRVEVEVGGTGAVLAAKTCLLRQKFTIPTFTYHMQAAAITNSSVRSVTKKNKVTTTVSVLCRIPILLLYSDTKK